MKLSGASAFKQVASPAEFDEITVRDKSCNWAFVLVSDASDTLITNWPISIISATSS